ncbi:MAG: preprotein translocase subunit YajC [Coriobacteriia bacterium]|nr:preprotein translocase subunit YajC [Coriobacteriia bacterium]
MNQTFTIVYLAVIVAAFYFLVIRPQTQRQRQQAALTASLREGDRVLTAGGVYGVVVSLGEESLRLQVADGVVVEVAKGAVVQRAEFVAGAVGE